MRLKDVAVECKACYIPCKHKVSYDNRHVFKCPSCRERYVVIGDELAFK